MRTSRGFSPRLTGDQVKTARRLYDQKDMTVSQIGEVLGVSRTTIYRALDRQVAPGRYPKHRAAESPEGCTGQDMTRYGRLGSVRRMADRWKFAHRHVQDGVPLTALTR